MSMWLYVRPLADKSFFRLTSIFLLRNRTVIVGQSHIYNVKTRPGLAYRVIFDIRPEKMVVNRFLLLKNGRKMVENCEIISVTNV